MSQLIKKLKDPGSAITHIIAAVMAALAGIPLLMKATHGANKEHAFTFIVFIASMVLLYTASSTYHSLNISELVNKRLKKFDHASIFILIAGSYTPICIIVLGNVTGYRLLTLVWTVAILGIIFKLFWVTCPKWVSSVMYIVMGWLCVLAFSPIVKNLETGAFILLLTGGIIYTVGGIIYALKLPIFNANHKYFGSHEIFHLFCIGGSVCHFLMVYLYLA